MKNANLPMKQTKNMAPSKMPQTALPGKPSTGIDNNDHVNNNSSIGMPADMTMMFMSCMDGLAAQCAPAIARAFDLGGHKTAADLGGIPQS